MKFTCALITLACVGVQVSSDTLESFRKRQLFNVDEMIELLLADTAMITDIQNALPTPVTNRGPSVVSQHSLKTYRIFCEDDLRRLVDAKKILVQASGLGFYWITPHKHRGPLEYGKELLTGAYAVARALEDRGRIRRVMSDPQLSQYLGTHLVGEFAPLMEKWESGLNAEAPIRENQQILATEIVEFMEALKAETDRRMKRRPRVVSEENLDPNTPAEQNVTPVSDPKEGAAEMNQIERNVALMSAADIESRGLAQMVREVTPDLPKDADAPVNEQVEMLPSSSAHEILPISLADNHIASSDNHIAGMDSEENADPTSPIGENIAPISVAEESDAEMDQMMQNLELMLAADIESRGLAQMVREVISDISDMVDAALGEEDELPRSSSPHEIPMIVITQSESDAEDGEESGKLQGDDDIRIIWPVIDVEYFGRIVDEAGEDEHPLEEVDLESSDEEEEAPTVPARVGLRGVYSVSEPESNSDLGEPFRTGIDSDWGEDSVSDDDDVVVVDSWDEGRF